MPHTNNNGTFPGGPAQSAAGRSWLYCLIVLSLVLIAYLPSLNAPYYLDDEHNIASNSKVRIKHVLDIDTLRAPGERVDPSRLFAYWTFGLNNLTTGLSDPRPLRATNLGIHLLNTVLVFYLFLQIIALGKGTSREPALLAALGAGFWGLHPINSQAVIYVVQRMTLLAGTFSLLILILFLLGRNKEPVKRWSHWSLMIPCLALGLLSKQTVALIPIPLLLLQWYACVNADSPDKGEFQSRRCDRSLLTGMAVLGIAYISGYMYLLPRFMEGFTVRPFTFWERVLTEGRVLISYLKLFWFPVPGNFHLLHDLEKSAGFLEPFTTVLSWLILIGILILGIIIRERAPLFFVSTAWFAGMHLMEGGPVPLELAFEHRNYIPVVLLSFLAALAVTRCVRQSKRAYLIPLALLMVLTVATSYRGHIWTSPGDLLANDQSAYPSSARIALYRANLLREQGKLQQGNDLLSGFVSRYPDPVENTSGYELAEIYVFLGNVSSMQGEPGKSRAYYERAVDLYPEHSTALYNLARSYLESGDPDQALTMLKRLEQLRPGWPALIKLRNDIRRSGRK